MRLKNRAKSSGQLGYLLGLLMILSLTALMANGQSSNNSIFPPLVYGTSQVDGTNIENANYRKLKNQLSIQYNEEIDRIDREFHRCTSQNRGNYQGIQNCINTARNAKQQLSVERQEFQRMLEAEHIARLDKIGRYWDRFQPGTNRRDGTNGKIYAETRPKPRVNRTQGIYRKGKIIHN